jgi:hypothetical protein
MAAPDSDSSGEIIIKGGSCEIEFADGIFDLERYSDPLNRSDRKKQRHKHKDYKIHRIVITGNQSFDSGDIKGGFKGEIKISYKR